MSTFTKSQKAIILANRMAANSNLTRSEVFSKAWEIINNNPDCYVLRATKKDGTKISRVIFTNWSDYNEVKGTGRPTPAHILLFVDTALHALGQKSTRSILRSNIQKLAA